jgi:glycosyltransferase involved in cell wall biosynthesis
VLVVTAHLPADAANQAGERISHRVLTLLAHRHEVHLVAMSSQDDETTTRYAHALSHLCASMSVLRVTTSLRLVGLAALPRLPLRVAVRRSPGLARLVARLVARLAPDVVLFDHDQMLQYLHATHGRRLGRVALVHDVLFQGDERRAGAARHAAIRALHALEARRTRAWELAALAHCDAALTLSVKDARLLADAGLRRPVHVMPPWIDAEWATRCAWCAERKEPLLLFWGAMNRGENVDAVCAFAAEILPRVRARVPAARFLVIGARPSPSLRRLAAHDPRIEVTGFVSDPAPLFERALVSVAPLRLGAGVKIKVLEAMRAGLPVVGTSVAAEGIRATGADGLFVHDDPAAFAERCVALLEQPAVAWAAGEAARRFVLADYDGRAATEALERALGIAAAAPLEAAS